MYKAWMFKQRSFRLQNPDNGDGNQNGGGGSADDKGGKTADGTGDDKGGDGKTDDKGGDKGTKVSDSEAKLLKEVMQRKEAQQKAQADLAAANERLKEFDGVDPVAIKKLLADQKAAEDAQLEAKGEFDRLKQRMADEHTATTKTLQEQIATLTAQLAKANTVADELSIGTQFAQSTFISDELTLTPSKARVVYGNHFDLTEGKVVAYDKPRGESNRTALVDQLGNPLPFDAALRKLVETDPDKDHLLKSKVRPGAGSESKKTDAKPKQEQASDSVSKIGAGLAGLNLMSKQGS